MDAVEFFIGIFFMECPVMEVVGLVENWEKKKLCALVTTSVASEGL